MLASRIASSWQVACFVQKANMVGRKFVLERLNRMPLVTMPFSFWSGDHGYDCMCNLVVFHQSKT